MKQNNLALSSDYKETWAKAKDTRERYYQGDFDKRERRDDVGRALYKLEKP